MPRIKRPHNEGKVEGQKLKIQEIIDTLNTPSAPLDETLPVDSNDTAAAPVSESGASLVPPSPVLYRVLISPAFPTPISQPAGAWLDVHLLCTNSPP